MDEIKINVDTAELKKMIDNADLGAQRWAAIRALGCKNTQESIHLLAHYLQSKDLYIKRAALEALSFHSESSSLTKQILAFLADASPILVRTACETVKSLKLVVAHDLIIKLIRDPSEETRIIALSTISELWRATDFGIILTIFKHDGSDSVKKEAAWVLYNHATSENWSELFNSWHLDNLPRHRSWACKLAAKFGSRDIRDKLKILAVDEDGHVRKAAQVAINER